VKEQFAQIFLAADRPLLDDLDNGGLSFALVGHSVPVAGPERLQQSDARREGRAGSAAAGSLPTLLTAPPWMIKYSYGMHRYLEDT
jgi:hypothetical protein